MYPMYKQIIKTFNHNIYRPKPKKRGRGYRWGGWILGGSARSSLLNASIKLDLREPIRG